jgi:beta-galactosidase
MQPVTIRKVNLARAEFEVHNWHHFADLGRYTILWSLLENGSGIESGTHEPLYTRPGNTDKLVLDLGKPALKPGAEYIVRIEFVLKDSMPWAEAGHIVAWEEFSMPYDTPALPLLDTETIPDLKMVDANDTVTLSAPGFSISFFKADGLMTSYMLHGDELVVQPLAPNFWRPYTDNDKGTGILRALSKWKSAGELRSLLYFDAFTIDNKTAKVVTVLGLPQVAGTLDINYTVYGDGHLDVDYTLKPGNDVPNIPRVGMQMQIRDAYDHMEWYGKGPQETYWDRQKGAMTGIYEASVRQDFFQYVRPQESNNKWDTRWAMLLNKNGDGLLISGEEPLSFSAWPYSMRDIEQADHINELPRRDYITVNIDHLQMGVGGDNSWSPAGRPYEEYQIVPEIQRYRFSISPASNGAMPKQSHTQRPAY